VLDPSINMNRDNRKTKKYVHKIAKRAIKLKRRQHRRYTMACVDGKSHRWRDYPHKGDCKQCKRCGKIVEKHTLLKILLVIIVIVLASVFFFYGEPLPPAQ
jgi:formamidopyrimidine-DNA glycosylase